MYWGENSGNRHFPDPEDIVNLRTEAFATGSVLLLSESLSRFTDTYAILGVNTEVMELEGGEYTDGRLQLPDQTGSQCPSG